MRFVPRQIRAPKAQTVDYGDSFHPAHLSYYLVAASRKTGVCAFLAGSLGAVFQPLRLVQR
jgi:hypothetical protein